MLDRLEVLNARIRSIPASKLMDLCLPQAEGHRDTYPAQAQVIDEMFGVHCIGQVPPSQEYHEQIGVRVQVEQWQCSQALLMTAHWHDKC